jgi:hypothetical protein
VDYSNQQIENQSLPPIELEFDDLPPVTPALSRACASRLDLLPERRLQRIRGLRIQGLRRRQRIRFRGIHP